VIRIRILDLVWILVSRAKTDGLPKVSHRHIWALFRIGTNRNLTVKTNVTRHSWDSVLGKFFVVITSETSSHEKQATQNSQDPL
jgi:hypothetical protein